MAQMYRFERNGVVKLAELIEQNDKAKTVTLKMEDGTYKATSLSTFKRWWKAVADEATEDTAEDVQEQEVDTNADVAKQEVAEEPKSEKKVSKKSEKKEKKEKAPKAKKEKKEALPPVDVEPLRAKALEICNKLGFEEKLYPNLPNMIVFKLDGKGKAEVRFSRKGFVINVKPEVLADDVEYKKINNYYLPAALNFTYDVYAKELERILKETVKWYGAVKKAASDTKEKKSKKKEKEEN